MNPLPPRRRRNPAATREGILVAARTLIARDGPEGLSLSSVAQAAGISRGTAYQHFATREKLVEATLESVSDMLYRATFGDPAIAAARDVGEIDIAQLTTALADFAIANPELGRIWFLRLLASEHPDEDPFIHHYLDMFRAFADTDLAVDGIDSEIMTLMTLSANFLWPVWAKAHEKDDAQRGALARRFVNEALRLALFGTMRSECHPEIAARFGAASIEPMDRRTAAGR